MRFQPAALIALALALTGAPAAAQYSDSFNLQKAIRDRDAYKAQSIMREPGSVAVNTKNDDGDTPLQTVIKKRDFYWVQLLMANGANVNGQDRLDRTPIMVAAEAGFTEAVRLLAANGARVNMKDKAGETALIKSVRLRDTESVSLLMAAGADADITDNTGTSARDYAQQDRRAAAVLKILQNTKPAKQAEMMGPSK